MAEQPGGQPAYARISSELDPIISTTLLIGVAISGSIIIIGFVLYSLTGKSGYPAGVFPVSPVDVVTGILHLKAYAIIDFGLFLLILTPVFRVAIGIVGFAREKDPNMVAATSYVLFMLLLSFFLGKAGG